jgi:aspartyl-tRNA(Asn)/glutamyl-tRNA(Gln) amidotransferase subunit C
MEITKKTIRWITELSNLSLSGEEEKEMMGHLKEILDYMDILGELDLEAVEPTAHTLGCRNVTRSDEEGGSFDIDVVKRLAPRFENGHIVVPRVV